MNNFHYSIPCTLFGEGRNTVADLLIRDRVEAKDIWIKPCVLVNLFLRQFSGWWTRREKPLLVEGRWDVSRVGYECTSSFRCKWAHILNSSSDGGVSTMPSGATLGSCISGSSGVLQLLDAGDDVEVLLLRLPGAPTFNPASIESKMWGSMRNMTSQIRKKIAHHFFT